MPNTPIPPELEQATENLADGEELRESHDFLHEIARCCARDDYKWGFRIFRTCYPPTCSDANFDRAMEILHEYMRFSCLMSYDDDVREAGGSNAAEQELAKRMSNDVVQDRESLEGASISSIQQLAKDWIAARGARISESARYRFFLVIDDEVVRHLLQFPTPVLEYPDEWQSYSVEVLDVEYDADTDKTSWRPGGPEFEGWFWAGAWRLTVLAFMDYIRDGREVYCFDRQNRPLHGMTEIEMS